MKNISKFTIAIAVFAIITGITVFANSEDSLISKSYFDQQISYLKDEFNSKISQIELSENSGSNTTGTAVVFKAVKINAGKTVIFSEGAEVIHRSGKAKLIDPTGNGVPDITSGKNIVNGQSIAKNHLLLFPRNDGRGLRTQTDIWIMLKGTASITE